MNLQNLSDQSLLNATEQLVREERELLTKILYHLHEIERRKLYCDKGFRSLFDFAVRGLGYSEDQAWRRIAAMKLLRELPELEVKITSGELSLSHLGLAHAAFRQEAKLLDEAVPVERKLNLISQIAAKPIREAERVTAAWSSSPAERVRDQVRTLGVDRVELRFEASLEVREKLATLKGYLAHEAPDLSLGELLDRLCELGLKHWRPSAAAQAGGTRAASLGLAPKLAKGGQDSPTASQEGSAALSKSSPATSRESCVNQSPQDREPTPRRHQSQVPSQTPSQAPTQARVRVIRQVFSEAQDRCQNCGSTYALEIDHIHPRAKGGGSERENLRVLCRNCNQRSAVKMFGPRVTERAR